MRRETEKRNKKNGRKFLENDSSGHCLQLTTCCLGSNQRGAGRIVMQSDDLHRVLSARLQTVDDGGLGVACGGWDQLPFALLGTGVQDPVGRDDSLGTVPADPQGGGLDVGKAEVFGVVHIWRWRI